MWFFLSKVCLYMKKARCKADFQKKKLHTLSHMPNDSDWYGVKRLETFVYTDEMYFVITIFRCLFKTIMICT